MASGEELTSTSYLNHHLVNLTFGRHPDGGWGFAHGAEEASEMGFLAVHVDTMFWSLLMGVLFSFVFYKAAQRASVETPTGFQNFIEMVVDFIDTNVKSVFTHESRLVAPVALTAFVWIVLMNTLDLVPVDWVPTLAAMFGIEYQKIVPTVDPNVTMGMSLTVFAMVIYFSIKQKGGMGFVKELTMNPFNHPAAIPINIVIELSGLLSKPISHGMRLFGNMFAGEIIFVMIAILFGAAWYWFPLAATAHLAWAIFHILVVLLQGFIFMMLTVVYLEQAHDAH
ncbi:F0F1 ATP synthase subunit A [Gammaproteobacteria bacterium]|nr:F0F1 ATP synthase subunit A [Gammaproteobacteria bacterium]